MMTRNRFIKMVVKEYEKNPFTAEQARAAANKKSMIGADGASMALTIAWLRETKPSKLRNKISDWLLIIWLKSCMRRYANFGNYNPLAACVVRYYYTALADRLEEREALNKEWNTNAADASISE